MRRLATPAQILAALAPIVAAVVIASCGSSTPTPHPARSQLLQTLTSQGGQREYRVRLPNGQVVIQAHDPQLAEPSKGLQLPRVATGVSTVEQYDSVNVTQIPSSAHYVAGYVDGNFRTWTLLRHFPVDVGIAVQTIHTTNCFDMEPGNPPATAAGPWALLEFRHGWSRPCEYTMLSWIPAVRASLALSGVSVCASATQAHCVLLWDANWTFVRHLDAGFACTQWTDHALGRNLDESTCASWFYKRVVPPPPLPVCFQKREPRATCSTAKARVAADRRAERAFGDAMHRLHCRYPYRRRACRSRARYYNHYWRDARATIRQN